MFGIKRIIRQARRRIIFAWLKDQTIDHVTVRLYRLSTIGRARLYAYALQDKFGQDVTYRHKPIIRFGQWSFGFTRLTVNYRYQFGRVGFLNELS